MKYAFIKALKQAKHSDITWRDFRYRMANYLIKQPPLSERFGYQLSGYADKVAVTADMTDYVIEINYIKD